MIARLMVAVAKPAASGGGTQRQAETRTAAAARGRSPPRSQRAGARRPWRRLAVGGEIERDAAAERDGEPGHQPSRADLDRHPCADALCRAAREIGETVRPASAGRRPAAAHGATRPPSFGPATRSVLLDHRGPQMPAIQLPPCYMSGMHGASASGHAFTVDSRESLLLAFPAVFAGKARAGRTPEAVPFPAHCRCARRRVGC